MNKYSSLLRPPLLVTKKEKILKLCQFQISAKSYIIKRKLYQFTSYSDPAIRNFSGWSHWTKDHGGSTDQDLIRRFGEDSATIRSSSGSSSFLPDDSGLGFKLFFYQVVF